MSLKIALTALCVALVLLLFWKMSETERWRGIAAVIILAALLVACVAAVVAIWFPA